MKIYPAGRGREVYRNIEICGSSTLNQLCQVILESFDFIDEHLYEFCMDNRMYSEHAYQSDPEGDEPSADITLDELEHFGYHEGNRSEQIFGTFLFTIYEGHI